MSGPPESPCKYVVKQHGENCQGICVTVKLLEAEFAGIWHLTLCCCWAYSCRHCKASQCLLLHGETVLIVYPEEGDIQSSTRLVTLSQTIALGSDSLTQTWQASLPPLAYPAHRTRSSMWAVLKVLNASLHCVWGTTGIWTCISCELDGPSVRGHNTTLRKEAPNSSAVSCYLVFLSWHSLK
jgi:hypothetical protein